MPLDPPRQPPKNQADWDRWARDVKVMPTGESVGTDQLVDNAVTGAKLRESAALSVIGNPTASPADPQDIGASADGQYLRRAGGGLSFGTIADADIPANIARDTEVAAAVSAHEAAVDPHPQYTTAAETAAAVSAGISAHVALTDPHTQYTNSTELAAAITALNLASGTYTPTLTNVANIDASTAYVCQYMRVGSVVTVSGKVDIDPTTIGVSTQLGISLPIASSFTASEQLGGTAMNPGVAADAAAIFADAANDRAQLQYVTAASVANGFWFSFAYRVI